MSIFVILESSLFCQFCGNNDFLATAKLNSVTILISFLSTKQLKPDVVTLVDSFAPPDWVLQSALGHSNGEVRNLIFIFVTLFC